MSLFNKLVSLSNKDSLLNKVILNKATLNRVTLNKVSPLNKDIPLNKVILLNKAILPNKAILLNKVIPLNKVTLLNKVILLNNNILLNKVILLNILPKDITIKVDTDNPLDPNSMVVPYLSSPSNTTAKSATVLVGDKKTVEASLVLSATTTPATARSAVVPSGTSRKTTLATSAVELKNVNKK